jgi:hypothetical protein
MLIAEQDHEMCPQETHDQCMCAVVVLLETEGLADAKFVPPPDNRAEYLK